LWHNLVAYVAPVASFGVHLAQKLSLSPGRHSDDYHFWKLNKQSLCKMYRVEQGFPLNRK
jgi:hypothetical protein